MAQEIEDLKYLSCIPIGTRNYKKKANKWYSARFWVWGWQ